MLEWNLKSKANSGFFWKLFKLAIKNSESKLALFDDFQYHELPDVIMALPVLI